MEAARQAGLSITACYAADGAVLVMRRLADYVRSTD